MFTISRVSSVRLSFTTFDWCFLWTNVVKTTTTQLGHWPVCRTITQLYGYNVVLLINGPNTWKPIVEKKINLNLCTCGYYIHYTAFRIGLIKALSRICFISMPTNYMNRKRLTSHKDCCNQTHRWNCLLIFVNNVGYTSLNWYLDWGIYSFFSRLVRHNKNILAPMLYMVTTTRKAIPKFNSDVANVPNSSRWLAFMRYSPRASWIL